MNSVSNKPENEFTLPQDECSPIFLKYFEGYSYREIASALDLPVSTVKERLRKSQQRLRVNLKLFARSFRVSIKKPF